MDYFDIQTIQEEQRLIIENEFAFAFLSYTPIVPGHTLVCPKRIISIIDDIDIHELEAILDLQKILKKSMITALWAEAFNYAWNEWELWWQSVNHLHLHMIPRKLGDTGIYEYDPRKFLYRPGARTISPQDELSEITALLKNTIGLH
jgi:diadenosine tetraphosphate (Ap4A) HIT family hydrolase